ncbi:hypothetical protein SODALDRAFT_402643 [Sodiomyces alkalinus F11]|uniref:Carbohydrate kinase FGGY N-terminal domain-containing protein n=1 Tax=Sodiomyces alkalinus (strain CBS 110278 / VKM F-3762 / F11) TaxID=1314773 RepID=A0A3N2PQ46_SODAK|nr:hypothetical protein SODALDRAFT_402643 [Sodiomyces alkalinus F11]ROT36629.1 hypothetical protein SODALDRAFT_402643 [Sodiomyces alkalinus F11]
MLILSFPTGLALNLPTALLPEITRMLDHRLSRPRGPDSLVPSSNASILHNTQFSPPVREILASVDKCITVALAKFIAQGVQKNDIKAIGIANQRETTIVWDATPGEPLYQAIVSDDTRTSHETNASRTLLMNLRTLDYEPGILQLFHIDPEDDLLPEIVASSDPRADSVLPTTRSRALLQPSRLP